MDSGAVLVTLSRGEAGAGWELLCERTTNAQGLAVAVRACINDWLDQVINDQPQLPFDD
jgi:hypothetical protein